MRRVPFGISRLDSMIGGGAPPGSTVLLAGEVGAGAREFLYTSVALNGLAHNNQELFDLYYGDLEEAATLPSEIHYLSFTAGEDALTQEMHHIMDGDLVEAGTEPVAFEDFSESYFKMSKVPSDWYTQKPAELRSLGEQGGRRDVLDTIGDYLSAHGDDSLVVIDSLTDLISAASNDMDWNNITQLIKGLKKAAYQWGGLVLLLVTMETLSETELGRLMEATDGTIYFEWESGGSERDRTMFVKQFRGVLSRLEEEDIIQFETEIHDGGFDISDVRKIR